ncbi:MAG: hypothetical protein PWP27_1436 [Clostridiales bacterium]|nr:hypothetical protein [Clostridiales bacterium]MDK2933626.1 hypothetical protein [Clostridiales bacterium]
MHKEVIKRQGNTFLIVVGLIVLVFIFMSILEEMVAGQYRLVVDIVSLVLFTILAFIILKYMVAEFKYMLIDTDLIFQRILGNRELVVLDVNLEDILIIAPAGSDTLKQYGKIDKTYNLCSLSFRKGKYCGIFKENGKKYRFIFEPSLKLIKLLKRSIPEKVFDA